jgi:hypothetical protein
VNPVATPDVGDLVNYAGSGFRVTGWLCKAEPVSSGDALVDEVLAEVMAEEAAERAAAGKPVKEQFRWCLPEEATHVSLAGVCGAVASISDVTVTGRVNWPEAHIASGRESALRKGREKTLLF